MKIACIHGYFIFEEERVGQVAKFADLYDLDFILKENYFTFSALETAKKYSILGADYLDSVATATFEGPIGEVFRANGLVYNINTDLVVPITTITTAISLSLTNTSILASGLIMPGSLTDDGSRVTDYSAHFNFDSLKFKYSEIFYE